MAVLVKHDIDCIVLHQISDHESLTLKVSCWGRSFLIFAVYRPPDSPPEYLKALYDHVMEFRHDRILLVGDFNLPGVDWENPLSSPGLSTHVSYLCDIMLSHDMHQIVTQPTRVHGSSNSILDLVFVSRIIDNFTVNVIQGISDHFIVDFSCTVQNLQSPRPRAKPIFVKNFSRAQDESVLDHLDLCLSRFHGSDAAELWDKFKNMCLYCLDNFIPNKVKRVRKTTPWITREILHMKRKLKRLKRRAADRGTIHAVQNTLNHAVASSKRQYFENTLPNFIRRAPEKFWRFLSSKKKPIKQLSHNGMLLVNPTDIAEQFNTYFQSVFSKSSDPMPTTVVSSAPDDDFVSATGVVSLLLNLKTKASPGPDNLPNIFLRRYAEMLSQFLVMIFRASLSSGTIPQDWKIARLVPVFKKGDPTAPGNYRPISITSSCCKLFEHIIANYITKFLEDRNLLSSFQHGFRKGFSTVTQLTSVVHSFANILDKSGQVDAIFLDFSKAFDVVSHAHLVKKLQFTGLPAFIINWISSYLINRKQFVRIDEDCSQSLPVSSGVPQGSVLGPLLFLVYVNDIVAVITEPVQIRLFADDCVLFNVITSREDQSVLNSNLHNIYNWCRKWNMNLNSDKSVFMKITNKKNSLTFPYSLPGQPLKEVTEYQYLGVTITHNLSWNKHISNICTSSFRKLGLLRHKLRHAPPSLKLLAYTSIIRPKLEYACIVWDPYTKTNIQALESIQRKAVRFIYSKYRSSDSPTQLMTQHNIPTLKLRRKIQRLKFLYLLKNNKLSMSPEHYIQPLTARRTRHRHAESLTPFNARTNVFKFSFFPRTVTEWNELPAYSITSTDSIDQIVF